MKNKPLLIIVVIGVLGISILSYLLFRTSGKYSSTGQTTEVTDAVENLKAGSRVAYVKNDSDDTYFTPTNLVYIDDYRGSGPVSTNTTGIFNDLLSTKIAKKTGRFVYRTSEMLDQNNFIPNLRVSDLGVSPKTILTLPKNIGIEGIAVSDDGEDIAFTKVSSSENSQSVQIFTISPSGTDVKEVLGNAGGLRHGYYYIPIAWSADKTNILLGYGHDGTDAPQPQKLVLLNLGTKSIKTIFELSSKEELGAYGFSPDGKRVAFWSYTPGPPEGDSGFPKSENPKFRVVDIDTRKATDFPSVDKFGKQIKWSADSTRLALDSDATISIVDVVTKKVSSVISLNKDSHEPQFAWVGSDRIAFVEAVVANTENLQNKSFLYSVRVDGAEKTLIDSALNLDLLGFLE